MNPAEQSTVYIGATRYYLGRMTYAVSDYCEHLRRVWPTLAEPVRNIIRRDVEETFKRDDEWPRSNALGGPLGQACDRAQWEKVRALWSAELQGASHQE